MDTLEHMASAAREGAGFGARLRLFTITAEAMTDAGFYVGAPRRALTLPKGLDRAKARHCGWHPGRVLREPDLDEMLSFGLVPEVTDFGHNVMANSGITRMLNLLIAAGGQAYDATHTALGVGDGAGSVPTAAATDTDLAALTGATHRYIQPANASYPSVSGQVLSIQATITSGNGLFHWREWIISQDTAGSTAAATTPILNHKGQDLGDFTGTSISKTLSATVTES